MLIAITVLGWTAAPSAHGLARGVDAPHDTAGVLSLEITGTPDPARVAERITMELLACNSGDSDVTGTVISGVVPAGVAFPAVTDGATCTSGACGGGSTLTWDIDTILAHRCRKLGLSMSVSAGTVDGTVLSFTFEMDVDGGGTVSDTFTVTVDSTSAFSLELSDDADPVAGGDVIQYTVAFSNRSSANVLNGSLTASVPAGTTLLSIEDGGTETAGTITWPLGTVGVAKTGRRRFSVTVDDPAVDGTAILADAEVTGTGESARATQATTVNSAETLRVYLTSNPDSVASGARILNEITLCNSGIAEATGVFIDSIVPNGINFPAATDGATCTSGACGAGGRLQWSLDTLGAGRCRSLPVSFNAAAAAQGDMMRPTFRLRADGGALSSATRTTTLDSTPKLLLAIGDDRDPVAAGETLTYTITYGNSATENGLNTTIRAWVPRGATLLSIEGGGTETEGIITWTLGTLRAGESGQRRFTVTVDPGATDGTAVVALASIDEDSGATFGATATQATTINGEAGLTLRITQNDDPVRRTWRVLYDFTLCNPGIDDAIGVVLDTVVPNGINFPGTTDGATCTSGACGAGGVLRWPLGDLAAHDCRTIQASFANAFVPDASLIALSMRLQADNRQTALAHRTVVGDSSPSLSLALVDDRDPVAPEGVVTYTLQAANRSTENVTAATLRFFVPADVTLSSIDDGGTEADGVVTWDLGTMAAGDAIQRRIVVTLDAGLADGSSIKAEADITGGSPEKLGARASQATSIVASELLTLDLVPHLEPSRVSDLVYLDAITCNRGPTDATGVVIDMFIPNYLNFGRSGEASPTCSNGACGAGSRWTWTPGDVLAGRCRNLQAGMLIASSASVGDISVPSARVRADGGSEAIATRTIAVNTSQPLTSFVGEAADPVAPGTDTSFDVYFGNRSASTFSNGELRVAIPPGASVVSASVGAVLDGDELSWGVCPMSTGQSGKYSYTVSLDDAATLPDGSALVTDVQFGALDGNPPASHARAVTAVVDQAPLRLDIATTPADIAKANDLITFDLTACNDGAGQATGVVIRMFVPRGMTATAIDDGGATNSAGEIVWNLDSINATECATVNATIRLNASGYLGDGTVLFSSARLLVDGGETATATHALRACTTTLAACTPKPPPPCAAPQSRACNRTASDALAILRTAVGLRSCPLCECDIDGTGSVTASDALGTLRFSVGQNVTLRCPACVPVQ